MSRLLPAILALGLASLILACGKPTTAPTGVAAKVWEEKELSAAVKGKTGPEVIKLLGPPDSTTGDPELKKDLCNYSYRNRLKDVANGKDITARIYFREGVSTGEVR